MIEIRSEVKRHLNITILITFIHHAALQSDRIVSKMEMEGIGSLSAKDLNAALGLPPPLKDDSAGIKA